MAAKRDDAGLYCSTSGTYFTDKQSLEDHYRSDFHLYNLRRKVAELPPVTREWFDARKEQLARAASSAAPGDRRLWIDPLTKKKFSSENTYKSYVNSKKYLQQVAESGKPAPEPIVVERAAQEGSGNSAKESTTTAPLRFDSKSTVKAVLRGDGHKQGRLDQANGGQQETRKPEAAEDSEDDSSGWETASEQDIASMNEAGNNSGMSEWEEWDVCRSLFDNQISSSFEANLEYMYKKFGFFFPDAEHLKDPQGLLKYLGAKIQYGGVPLYVRGDAPNPKQFRTLQAVQQHMVDTNRCKMLFDGNEDEYEDFYDLSFLYEPEGGGELITSEQVGLGTGGYELILMDNETGREKVLGTREFAQYYKQRPRPLETRESVLINQIVAKYRTLGIRTDASVSPEEKRSRRVAQKKADDERLRVALRSNVNRNLPRNVPY